MLFASVPFDYVQHLGREDRTRRPRALPDGSRVRRGLLGRGREVAFVCGS